ncbi:TetR/AcrR family transcriptional regulator C-terminal ligand-binding domain-containing protein [Leifsonia sp. ZF2019]|uniref:TetR-like C-terminal domain-containing protein n=1 Tax=Leifsonia sp. ZF2019 TaxID=2781978 RepID=UPI001CC0A8FC|nr:TetR/AcrR family transcriptional regulator C-terminal ligand-binding domain-containing protein [Leifsonia sp. ZF2019]
MAAELTDPLLEPLLRAVTAELQVHDALAVQYRDALRSVQMAAIAHRLERGGVTDPDEVAEPFVGPIMHRWWLHSHPLGRDRLSRHDPRTIRAGVR